MSPDPTAECGTRRPSWLIGNDLPPNNTKLNAEFVTIHNFASTNRVITGWTIRDLSGHVYKFGAYTLRPGVSLRLHTGNGTNTPTNHYWHQGYYVWTNTGNRLLEDRRRVGRRLVPLGQSGLREHPLLTARATSRR